MGKVNMELLKMTLIKNNFYKLIVGFQSVISFESSLCSLVFYLFLAIHVQRNLAIPDCVWDEGGVQIRTKLGLVGCHYSCL